ncbi:hypothetical protein [Cryobacterium sp. Y29]|uniref:hypothetical protein n=1 Tax=Cryobacterium sp. Y29 TaxID=2048285 RepID=UPI001304A24D|nr:hypothetical protein [Cryobacterium sp. Y29]
MRSLADCCAAYDIDLIGAHRASVDAYATAYRWPILPSSARPWYARPDFAMEQTASAFLERISVRLPEITGPAEQQDYLALLDRCLLDRQLSTHKAVTL